MSCNVQELPSRLAPIQLIRELDYARSASVRAEPIYKTPMADTFALRAWHACALGFFFSHLNLDRKAAVLARCSICLVPIPFFSPSSYCYEFSYSCGACIVATSTKHSRAFDLSVFQKSPLLRIQHQEPWALCDSIQSIDPI